MRDQFERDDRGSQGEFSSARDFRGIAAMPRRGERRLRERARATRLHLNPRAGAGGGGGGGGGRREGGAIRKSNFRTGKEEGRKAPESENAESGRTRERDEEGNARLVEQNIEFSPSCLPLFTRRRRRRRRRRSRGEVGEAASERTVARRIQCPPPRETWSGRDR
ncbi:hypothetical protein NL676_022718 [Syzygium grande]|nr:hypothetical protein NL676_022718 [Syzygium grande]